MKLTPVFFTLALLALFSIPTYADSGSAVWDVTASSSPCVIAPDSCGPVPVTIDAQFKTILETGEFYSPSLDHLINGTEPVVVGITGLLNGTFPMSFVTPPYTIDGGRLGWLLYGLPQDVWFSADGTEWEISNDGAFTTISNVGNGRQTLSVTFVTWSAVQVPEPASFVLLTAGLLGLAFLKVR